MALSLGTYNDVLKRQKEKDMENKQLTKSQSNEINKLREDVESKFEQILLKINVEKLSTKD
jgi:hypothetical protein